MMLDAFHDHLSQLFWEDFGDQLLKEDPERYQWEYLEFISLFSYITPC